MGALPPIRIPGYATGQFHLMLTSIINLISLSSVFTARCYASAVLAMALCPSVRPSVTSRCSTKTAKHRITQTRPRDTPGNLVY